MRKNVTWLNLTKTFQDMFISTRNQSELMATQVLILSTLPGTAKDLLVCEKAWKDKDLQSPR